MEYLIGILTGSGASKIYSAIVLLVLLATSLLAAHYQAQAVTGIPDRVTFRGRKPFKAVSIKRRLDVAKGFRRQALVRIVASFFMVLAWGVLVPGALLLFVLVNINWYFPGLQVFVSGANCTTTVPVPTPSTQDLLNYVATQTYAALAIDYFHGLVSLPVTRIAALSSNLGVSALLAGYKLYLSGYAGNWIRTVAYGLFNLLFRMEDNKEQIQELQKQYDEALEREASA